jgi:hypothetical protein
MVLVTPLIEGGYEGERNRKRKRKRWQFWAPEGTRAGSARGVGSAQSAGAARARPGHAAARSKVQDEGPDGWGPHVSERERGGVEAASWDGPVQPVQLGFGLFSFIPISQKYK